MYIWSNYGQSKTLKYILRYTPSAKSMFPLHIFECVNTNFLYKIKLRTMLCEHFFYFLNRNCNRKKHKNFNI